MAAFWFTVSELNPGYGRITLGSIALLPGSAPGFDAVTGPAKLYPALPGARGHDLWQRDFNAASGLFGVVLRPVAYERIAVMLNGMRLFGMGWSWGGFESLIIPAHPERIRTATRWEATGPYLRLHVGLEDTQDLIADLEDGLARLASHSDK